MKAWAVSTLKRVDRRVARVSLEVLGDRRALIVLLFHSLFADEAEVESGVVAPQQGITVARFREIVAYFHGEGYRFADPAQLQAGLDARHRYVLLTFDDGYFNNARALPVLHEFGVPALFFISTRHVAEQKAFWWDVLYREAQRRGVPAAAMRRDKQALKRRRTAAVERLLAACYGEEALRPVAEADRPFTLAELEGFARDPWVHLGNHTDDHAILTNYTFDEVRAQVRACQEVLRSVAGAAPSVISYPNGSFSRAVVEAARAEGLTLGITGVTAKNYLPLSGDAYRRMTLGRMVPYGHLDVADECRAFRADVRLYGFVKNTFNRRKTR